MSLKEIARQTGVSVSTVSRVLSGRGDHCAGKEVREKIWAAARKAHYIPNTAARDLRTGAAVAAPPRRVLIVPARFASVDEDPFFAALYRAVLGELLARGGVADRVLSAERFLREKPPACDGLLLLGRCDKALLPRLRAATENLVGVGRNPSQFQMDEVICSGEDAAAAAMEYLTNLGHRRIAYIGDCTNESRYEGYCKALMSRGLPLDYSLVMPTDQTRRTAAKAMETLLQRKSATAVLCANDASGMGALETLHRYQHSKKYPVSVIAIDNVAEAARTAPPLTTINIPAADMAHLAVNILWDRMEHKHTEPVRIVLPCRLVVRDSCYLV